jgi:hypothetical protein
MLGNSLFVLTQRTTISTLGNERIKWLIHRSSDGFYQSAEVIFCVLLNLIQWPKERHGDLGIKENFG